MVHAAMFSAVLVALLASASAMYSAKGDVIQAGADDFTNVVLKSKGIVIVEFYAPWCGHCKSLVPEYEKAAQHLSGVVKVVSVDATQHESLASKYQVKGFPTIMIFGADKKSPTNFEGQRTADAIVDEGMKQASSLVRTRKSGKKSASAKKSGAESKGKAAPKKGTKGGKGKSEVVELTDLNFNALVMESEEPWVVEFFAPWCGHCKALEPEYLAAAKELKADGIRLGAVDATQHAELAQRFGVKGYPTIKMFAGGAKKKARNFEGPRQTAGIVEYARANLGGYAPPIEGRWVRAG
ncbi:thioredoxin-like protein [Ochromonadaceae sp. CCMP2298]|nr:thioredoxin-like protein [Ochromonadaceae sp. CCMP2298]